MWQTGVKWGERFSVPDRNMIKSWYDFLFNMTIIAAQSMQNISIWTFCNYVLLNSHVYLVLLYVLFVPIREKLVETSWMPWKLTTIWAPLSRPRENLHSCSGSPVKISFEENSLLLCLNHLCGDMIHFIPWKYMNVYGNLMHFQIWWLI
jgi:hypothetical protein